MGSKKPLLTNLYLALRQRNELWFGTPVGDVEAVTRLTDYTFIVNDQGQELHAQSRYLVVRLHIKTVPPTVPYCAILISFIANFWSLLF